MHLATDLLLRAALTGAGATAMMDIVAMLRQSLAGTAAPDYGLVGRWLAYMPRGQFRHRAIAASPAVQNEKLIGWAAHYLIGIGFAGLLLAIFGPDWARHPTLAPALIVGIGSVAAPYLLMQPGMGAGLAARKTPRPNAARLRSLITHTVFAAGLYLADLAQSLLPL
jgi:hypothetical protein